MGCNESKADVLKIDQTSSKDNGLPSNNRRSSVNIVRQSSSGSLLRNISVKTINNNQHTTDLPTDLGSAGSSGRGSKPQTPPDESLEPEGTGLPGSTNDNGISSISGRIPSAMEQIPSSDLGVSKLGTT